MKANRAIPSFAVWIVMALMSWFLMPFVARPIEAASDPGRVALMFAAAGVGLGAVLLWNSARRGAEAAYANTHMFFFISLGLALGGWTPAALTFTLLGPLLAGYGVGSFLAILVLAVITPTRAQPGTPKAEDHAEAAPDASVAAALAATTPSSGS